MWVETNSFHPHFFCDARSFRQSPRYDLLPVFQNLGRRDLTELSDKNSGYNIVNGHWFRQRLSDKYTVGIQGLFR